MKLDIVSFILGFVGSSLLLVIIQRITNHIKRIKEKKDLVKQFSEIYQKIIQHQSKFKTRIKNIIVIESSLYDYGEISVIYHLDKNELHIYKDEKCLYSLNDIQEKELNTKIINSIQTIFNKEINDLLDFMGINISRSELTKQMNIQINELKNTIKLKQEKNDIQGIITHNEIKLDIDEILDKISQMGIESLTEEEKEFLKKFK